MKKLDFVIAWVDGSDENHRLKRQQFQPENVVKGAAEDTRFAHNDEMYFSIASILKYVPYCGTIYIITDHQQPSFVGEFEAQGLCRSGQIQVVDHQEIFRNYQQYLPTFNSLSIESMLWNIKGISNHFIYLNDDFFLNQQSDLSDFLIDGQMVIYGHWQATLIKKMKYIFRKFLQQNFGMVAEAKYSTAQMLSADRVGMTRYYEIHHRPHILSRDLLSTYFKNNKELLEQQIQFKFRNIDQLLPVGLSNHLAIQSDQAILKDDIDIAYLKDGRDLEKFILALSNSEIKFGCIQSLDQLESLAEGRIRAALIQKFTGFLPSQIQPTTVV
jgi:hypothetical protein